MISKPISLVENDIEKKLVSDLVDQITVTFSEYFLNNSNAYFKNLKGSNLTDIDTLLWKDQVWEATEFLKNRLKEKIEEVENQLLSGEFY